MQRLATIGAGWLTEQAQTLTELIEHVTPSIFNEQNRYLPESVTSMPGFIRYDVNPFMREILDCADVDSPVREVSLMKGVQITYSTLLESIMLYVIVHVRTCAMMYMSADKDLAQSRIENNILPMLNHSGFMHLIRSSDIDNKRKTGKTAKHLQWDGGGYMVPFGAQTAHKGMRDFAILYMLKDELDTWPDIVGKDGDPDKLSDDRCSGSWERRKIFRGSTPLIKGHSKIEKAFKRGDQRRHLVLCKACSYPQVLRWSGTNEETGHDYGFTWELEDGQLLLDSVRYRCQDCGHEHFEQDKERLFSPDHGAHWQPTAKPVQPFIRSYHLPAFYSPIGMQPWYKAVALYLDAYDPEEKKVKDIALYQVFYNNVLAETFRVEGSKVHFRMVSAHRRPEYRQGEIPNKFAEQYNGSRILFLTCQADIHKSFIACTIMGWTRDCGCYVIEYLRFEDDSRDGCTRRESPAWGQLQEIIEEREYTSDDGKKYRVQLTLVDAGYVASVVTDFCAEYTAGVYPILGRDRPSKNQTIREFDAFKTKVGTTGYRIVVDHYKDRLAPVLRRAWSRDSGQQKPYHFNAPVDITDKQLTELTVETLNEKTDDKTGYISYFWHCHKGQRNELWDLFVYGNAAVDIIAWNMCVGQFELETVDWLQFWNYIENEELFFS